MGEHLRGGGADGKGLAGGGRCVVKADWLTDGSHLGGLQHLDVLVGAVALIVLSGHHAVVSPAGRSSGLNTLSAH